MADPAEQPRRWERVHLRHAKLGGALCRARPYPAPWVTEDIGLVTCLACEYRLRHPDGMPRAVATEVADEPVTAVRATSPVNRVHARGTGIRARYGRTLCGHAARELPQTSDPEQVTCRNCQRALRKRPERAVGHG